MFGLSKMLGETIENVIDVGVGIVTLNEYGDFSKKSVSKMIADGIEITLIAETYGTSVEIVKQLLEDE